MTIQRRVMWGLRIYGPVGNAELARHLGLHRLQVYGATWSLREEGLAVLGRGGYDLSAEGRRLLADAVADQPRESQLTFWEEPYLAIPRSHGRPSAQENKLDPQ